LNSSFRFITVDLLYEALGMVCEFIFYKENEGFDFIFYGDSDSLPLVDLIFVSIDDRIEASFTEIFNGSLTERRFAFNQFINLSK
jgi:hypothetical protein